MCRMTIEETRRDESYIKYVAAYVWRNYEPARDWGKDILISWLGYHSMNRTLGIRLTTTTRTFMASRLTKTD
jgi:hypothetical protein